jgi:carboxypeptidase C (cathepsin A)
MSDEKDKTDPKKNENEEKPQPKEVKVEKTHKIMIDGKEISYKSISGKLILKHEVDEKEPQAKASIFYIAYIKEGVDDPSKRPIMYSFNGGPGSSSVWLHMGLLGPKRVIAEKDGQPVPPPYQLIDNEYSILDLCDLVFIDPVSTGYSRAVPGEKAEQFHNVQSDIEAVGEFIRLFTTKFGKWLSPKFLIGESYGTTRAAGLSGFLQDRFGMFLNGIILVSSILNFVTARFDPGNIMPHALFLPTYTATSWYHKRLSEDLQTDLNTTLKEVEKFVYDEYLPALLKGDNLAGDEKDNIVTKLSRYTGLKPEYLEQTNLRINIMRFIKELLKDKRRTVGRLDSRFQGIDLDAAGSNPEFDPSYPVIQGPYSTTFNDYVRNNLGFEEDIPYEILTGIYMKWKNNYSQGYDGMLNVAETLRSAMSKNPFLKVHIDNGYFDLATPYFATIYTFNQLNLDPSLRDNISMEFYEAGHMMYIDENSLKKQKSTIKNFVERSSGGGI